MIDCTQCLGCSIRYVPYLQLAQSQTSDFQHVTHVLHPATKIPAKEPDLRPSKLPNLPSHSETLKINLERAIAAIGPSSVRGMREIGRLMDWSPQERVRTASYCIAYFTCWVFGYALLGVMSFGVAVICFPSCRRYFFPAVRPPIMSVGLC